MSALSEYPLRDLDAARDRLDGRVHRTPVVGSTLLDERTGARLAFKCENVQRTGSFKIRGATNAALCLTPKRRSRGLATHSSGNHAQAVARAARELGVAAHIVMPDNSSAVKVEAVRGYGASVTFCEPTVEARERTAERVVAETGAAFVHPYDQRETILGQTTATREFLEQSPELDVLLVPIGGGGLVSGALLAARHAKPGVKIVGVEPAGADDAHRGWRAGERVASHQPNTIADGLRTTLGERTYPIIRELIDDIVTVCEEEIVQAWRLLLTRLKQVVEPSAAVAPAAAFFGKTNVAGKRVGVILCGGNIDLPTLSKLADPKGDDEPSRR